MSVRALVAGITGCLIGVALTTVSGAVASTTAPTVIRACADKDTGALRLRDEGERCRKRRETAVRWSQRGPRGYTGPQGLTGPAGPAGPAGPMGPAGPSGQDGQTTTGGTSSSPGGDSWANGPGALAAADSGTTQATAFGVKAVRWGTGANNTGLGYGALRGVVGGYGNTGIGAAPMFDAGPDARFNVAIGLHAGRYITGNGNVVIGAEAAGSAGSIDDTVVIGRDATANGDGRVAIGARAQAIHQDSIALGKNAVTTRSSQVNVGARDVEVTDPSRGVVLVSPNGTRFRITVADDGSLTTTPAG